MMGVQVAALPKERKSAQYFTKEQYAQFKAMLSPAEILEYIANHEEEYRLFQEQEKQECEVQK